MKLLALLLLLPSVTLGQGITKYRPGQKASARTNYALRSTALTVGAAGNSPWLLITATAATGVETSAAGSQWSKITSAGAAGERIHYNNGVTVPSSNKIAVSVSARKAAGTGATMIAAYCADGLQPTACTCWRSDGGTCAASAASPFNDRCAASVSDLGTTEIRLGAIATCQTAGTTPWIMLYPVGATAAGTTWFTDAQMEVNVSKPSAYCPTTAAAVTCK
jgi:hypothetical protein